MLQLPWLDSSNLHFPSTDDALAEPNGLLAAGGDLSSARLIEAYKRGIFPWYDDDQPILWWSPSPRTVLFPNKVYISKSLKKRLKQKQFTVTTDKAFSEVMTLCAQVPRAGQDGTWICDDMIHAYTRLHHEQHAHSVEVWQNEALVGGLYGIAIGGIFFGESMFSLTTDASKVALVYLAKQLAAWDFALIDCQIGNPHLFSMGAEEINKNDFNRYLSANISNTANRNWDFTWEPLTSE